MLTWILLAIAALVVVAIATSSFKIIGQAEVMVIERLGRFHRVARSGLNILIPVLERPKSLDVRYLESDVGGIKKITIWDRRGQAQIYADAYGDLSACNMANMTTRVMIGNVTYSHVGTWIPTPTGWRLPLGARKRLPPARKNDLGKGAAFCRQPCGT